MSNSDPCHTDNTSMTCTRDCAQVYDSHSCQVARAALEVGAHARYDGGCGPGDVIAASQSVGGVVINQMNDGRCFMAGTGTQGTVCVSSRTGNTYFRPDQDYQWEGAR